MVTASLGPRFNKVRMLENEEDYSFPDRDFLDFASSQGVADVQSYGIVHPTAKNFQYALSQSDRREVYNLDPRREKMAWRALKHHFSAFFGRCRKVPYEKIECVPDTSPGFPWGCAYKDKEEALKHHADWFEYYLKDGVERPYPIYKCTPKSEYLTKDEIASGKIRLFRNPPLDFLLLQVKYFGQMEELLSQFLRLTKSALGFSKENGGWSVFTDDLMRFKYFHRHDVRYFDKAFGRKLKEICYKLRRKFYAADEEINEDDWKFLLDGETFSLELLPNGQCVFTVCGGKSGNLTTSTDNTIAHCFESFYHLSQYFPTEKDLISFIDGLWCAYIYSDDIQGSTNYPQLFAEEKLRESFQCFGKDIKDYHCSPYPESIHFLGAANFKFRGKWVPKYDQDRMLYALGHLSGHYPLEVRAQRILSLAKNLAFSPYCKLVCAFAERQSREGKWPRSVPLPTVYGSQRSFLKWESTCRRRIGTKRSGRNQTMQKQQGEKTVSSTKPVMQAKGKPGKSAGAKGARKLIKREALESNYYLKNLINPEGCPGVRYPDHYPRKTSVFQGIINDDIYYFTGEIEVEPLGTFLTVISPTLMDPVLSYRLQIPDSNAFFSLVVQNQTETSGLYPLVEDIPTTQVTSDTMHLKVADIVNVKNDVFWSDQTEAVPQFRGNTTDGNVFYGFPIWNSAQNIHVVLQTDEVFLAATGNSKFELRAVTKNNIGAWIPFTGTTNRTDYVLDRDNTAFGLPTSAYTGMPGVGWQLRYNDALSTEKLVTINSFRLQWFPADDLTDQPRMVPVTYPDQTTYAKVIDQYRVVGMSAWTEYEGSDLKNGGQLAAVMYRGGQSAMGVGLWDYNKIAEVPGGRQGGVKFGNYSFWLPSNSNDMLMRRLNATSRWEHPFIVFSGFMADIDQLNALRLRVVTNFEAISTAQFLPMDYTVPNEEAIKLAALALRDYPSSMENPDHLKTIRRILGEVTRYANKAASFYQDNKGWMIPAGAALATLI